MKMKKNAVALGVAALVGGLGFAGAASAGVIVGATSNATALRVNAGGIGHSLIIPYFSTNNGNSTLINLVNTDTVNGKAVKVRFRGASNSDDLLDFQVLMSPGDVWTANVSSGANGVTQLLTNDNTCTLPNIKGTPVNAVLDRLPGFIADRGAQTREGYVELFTMADIRPGSALFTATKHVGGVAPCTASVLQSLTTNPTTEAAANALGLYVPTTGLFENHILVNQAGASTSWSEEATTLLAVRTAGTDADGNPISVAANGNIVFFPQTSDFLPNPDIATADPLLRTGGTILPLMFDAPDLSTPYLNNTTAGTATGPLVEANRLSASLATLSIRNEFLTVGSISAASDWTFSFPTRRYSVAVAYGPSAATSARLFSNLTNNYFTVNNTSLQTNAAGIPQVCVSTRGNTNSSASDLRATDQEEAAQLGGFVISPGTATSIRFCGEVSVLSFNNGTTAAQTGVLRANIARQDVMVPYSAGWMTIDTSGNGNGLPVLGRYFLRATNPANAGFSTNFGASFEHRYDRPLPAVTQGGAALQ